MNDQIEYMEYLRELEKYHQLFYKIWEIGRPIFSDKHATAAIEFNKDGEFVSFIFNKDFWDSRSFNQRLFIICHETLHVALQHGPRMQNFESLSPEILNVAADIAVNHALINHFGFLREEIDPNNEYIWIDKVFDFDVKDNENLEYYYELMLKNSIDALGAGDTVDIHNFGTDWSQVVDYLNNELSPYDKKTLEDFIKKHTPEKCDTEKKVPLNQQAGTGQGGVWTFVNPGNIVTKRKFETVIKNWVLKTSKYADIEVEQWVRKNRRYANIDLKDFFIPSEMEVNERIFEKNKIDVWFFLDASGSCWNLKDRFFRAACSIPRDKFDVKLFSFDTSIYELDINEPKIIGSGGTSFSIIEEYIQSKSNGKYPSAVFLITDGYGDQVNIQYPQNWYWFLSENYREYIPQECNIYNLEDYE